MTPELRAELKAAVDRKRRELAKVGLRGRAKRDGRCSECGRSYEDEDDDCYTCRARMRARNSEAKKRYELVRSERRKELRKTDPSWRERERRMRAEQRARARESLSADGERAA